MHHFVLCSCLLVVVSLGSIPAVNGEDDHAAAIAAITKLGGTVGYDERREKVLTVSLRERTVTDGDLIHLSKLVDLKDLDLGSTQITDAGLGHLQALTKLEEISLYNTVVSDAGLEHLTRMPKLGFLMLKRTHVTAAGAQKMQRLLPDCLVSFSPRTPAELAARMPVGKWSVTFANGVRQTCEIREDGAASVVEPRRTSKGKAVLNGESIVVTFEDERAERWTPVAERLVVEHWYPAVRVPVSTPVLGIAERVN